MRIFWLFVSLSILVLACLWASLVVGHIRVSNGDILKVLLTGGEVNQQAQFVLEKIRLPRALTALAVGGALAVAGAICQAVLRNPLAEPSLIGINGGASVTAMVLIVQMESAPLNLLPWASFAGALVTTAVIFFLAWRGGISPMRLILIGIGVSALTGAASSLIATFVDVPALQRAMIWLSGSFYDSNWPKIYVLYAWLIVPLAVAFLMHRELDLLSLNEDLAASVGLRVVLVRTILLILCAGISAAAVSTAGLIGFVGLVCPHVARILVGARHILLLPVAALSGAVLVMSADLIGNNIMAPEQFPVGLVTAMIGAPFFMFLLWKRSNV